MGRRHWVRGIGICASALFIFLATTRAAAGESKGAVCTSAHRAYKSALERKRSDHLREAMALSSTCMRVSGCAGVASKCTALYDKLASTMPTVVPIVTDEAGQPRVDVRVNVDGAPLATELDGRGLRVEPGLHEFAFSTDRGEFATRKILIIEGQRNRFIPVSMGARLQNAAPAAASGPSGPETQAATDQSAAPDKDPVGKASSDAQAHDKSADEAPPESSPPASRASNGERWAPPRSPLPYAIAGVGLAGLAAGGILTYWGNKDNTLLEVECSPHCGQASLDHIRTMYVASDLAFGGGAVALAVATFLFATSHTTEKTPTESGAIIDIHPTLSGAVASVSGSF